MGLNFQVLRGSPMRARIRRSCSSIPTSSQYLRSMVPPSTIIFSNIGVPTKKVFVFLFGTEAHDTLDPSPVIPTPIKEHDLSPGRKVNEIPLTITLRFFPFGWGRQGHNAKYSMADAIDNPFNHTTLSSGITSFKNNDDSNFVFHHPFLELSQAPPATWRARPHIPFYQIWASRHHLNFSSSFSPFQVFLSSFPSQFSLGVEISPE